MNIHANLLGPHQLEEGRLFRFGVGQKYLLMLTLSLPVPIVQVWSVTPTVLALMITLLISSRIDLARMLWIGWAIWLILRLLAAYQLVILGPRTAVAVPGNLLLVVLTTRLLTLITPAPELLNVLIMVLRPIRSVGLNLGRMALTVALMIRSIPYLLSLFDGARNAARARGAERNVAALLMPTVPGSVAHAERTGKVLATRGFGEREQQRTSSGRASAAVWEMG